jgi:AraC-like DNA-binding protein
MNVKTLQHSFDKAIKESISYGVSNIACYPNHTARKGIKSRFSKWNLEYHTKNAGQIFLGQDDYPVDRGKNTIHLFAPGCVRSEDTTLADLPTQETFINFFGGRYYGLDIFISNKYKFALFYDDDNFVNNKISKIVDYCYKYGHDSYWMVQGLFSQIIFAILNCHEKLSEFTYRLHPENFTKKISFANEVELFMRKNIDQKIKLDEIAEYMNVSKSQLCHRFKEETGVSPIDRLITIRIEMAKHLLFKGEKLSVIADMTGFCNEYHLSKSFKSKMGCTPSEFKKGVKIDDL